jgi:hypothetical protein
LATKIFLGRKDATSKRSILTSTQSDFEKGGKIGREVILGRLDDRRKRCEGEGAWENREMAQVPFYNSGDLWQHDACASVRAIGTALVLVTSFSRF